MATPRLHSRRGSSIVPWLIGASIVTLLVFLFLPMLQRGREPRLRYECRKNLKQIGLALHNYHDVYGMFPPAHTIDANGRPLHSWRTLLLPFLEHQALYAKIDLTRPWDDPVNASARETPVAFFACPSLGPKVSNRTSYLGLVGAEACFSTAGSRSRKEFKDGTERTLMVIEVSADQATQWMEPVDADEVLLMGISTNTIPPHSSGFHALTADGAVQFLSNETPAPIRRAMLTIAGDDNADLRDQ